MKFFTLILVVFLAKSSQNRKLWESRLPEMSVPKLEKENPIKLENNNDKVQISDLNGTLYSNSFSKLRNVTELRIVHNQIKEIQPGAFCSSQDLRILEIDFNKNRRPPTLTKQMFDSCDLEELFLKFDYENPSKIDQNALESLENLKTLAIDSLELSHLKKDYIIVDKNLSILILSHIHLTKIDVDVFSDLTNLEEIEIVHNLQLTHLPRGLFTNLKKLKRLILKDNAIKDLSWDEFEGLVSLEELDVFDNQISSFDAGKIAKNMPNIRKLYTEFNPVKCQQRRDFETALKAKLNHSVEIPSRYFDIYEPC